MMELTEMKRFKNRLLQVMFMMSRHLTLTQMSKITGKARSLI